MKEIKNVTNWADIESLLESWFTLGLTRKDSLPFHSSKVTKDDAVLAGSIFKRGAQQLHDLTQNELIPISIPQQSSKKIKNSTQIEFSPSLANFLNNHDHKIKNSIFVCDENVFNLHPCIQIELTRRNIPFIKIICTEKNKILKTVISLLANIPSHTEQIFAIGGGICTDIVGFVGALASKKINYLPTSLLAIVDAGLGGKTGVNHTLAGKNQIGRFVNIDCISVIDEFLDTLTPSLLRQGLAEMIKHSFLDGTFERQHGELSLILHSDSAVDFRQINLRNLLRENIEFKKKIVQADPNEKNIRTLLNFGHTTAHLLEGLISNNPAQIQRGTKQDLNHGVAVAIGMLTFSMSKLAYQIPMGFDKMLEELIAREGFSFPIGQLSNFKSIAHNLLLQDKKNTDLQSKNVICVTPTYGCLKDILHDGERTEFMNSQLSSITIDSLLSTFQKTGLFE